MADQFQSMFNSLDQLIRSGKGREAGQQLLALKRNQFPRPWLAAFASLYRRVGLNKSGLKLLTPILLGDFKPTDHERAEYGLLLERVGAGAEAISLLQAADGRVEPRVFLYLALCHIGRWEYQEAIPLLEKFLDANRDPYFDVVARVNLASATVHCDQYASADRMLTELIRDFRGNSQHVRLLSNCRELKANIKLENGDLTGAKADLLAAQKLIGQQGTADQLLILKGLAIVRALETKSLLPLARFQKVATARGHWETVRDCDYWRLKIKFSDELFSHLYFGSPLEAYRNRILRRLKAERPTAPRVFGDTVGRPLDLVCGTLNGVPLVKFGQQQHMLLATLSSDFYKPFQIAELFAGVFRGERFNVFNSPSRIAKVIQRTRRSCGDAVLIKLEAGACRLQLSAGIHLVRPPESLTDPDSIYWHRLIREAGVQTLFSSREACGILQLSRGRFAELSRRLSNQNRMRRIGRGPKSFYKITAA
jgi:tetratricopeptide (TPR) repeat protein